MPGPAVSHILRYRVPPIVSAGSVAFSWANYSDTTNVNAVTSFTVGSTNPAASNGSIALNDLLVMAVCVSVNAGDPGSLTPPGGWTEVANHMVAQDSLYRYGLWYKLAGGAEGGTYSTKLWTIAGSVQSAGAQMALRV